mmetsp:Transcript_70915/g.207800  ORF Transcript_70915/g.207800 Transcript_70915/m.207800 type:complete len:231 (-) Transcript_70915:77-769(-)
MRRRSCQFREGPGSGSAAAPGRTSAPGAARASGRRTMVLDARGAPRPRWREACLPAGAPPRRPARAPRRGRRQGGGAAPACTGRTASAPRSHHSTRAVVPGRGSARTRACGPVASPSQWRRGGTAAPARSAPRPPPRQAPPQPRSRSERCAASKGAGPPPTAGSPSCSRRWRARPGGAPSSMAGARHQPVSGPASVPLAPPRWAPAAPGLRPSAVWGPPAGPAPRRRAPW